MSRYTTLAVELTGVIDAAQALSAVPARILQAQQFGLADVLRSIGPEAKRDIRQEYKIRAGRIEKDLTVRKTADGVSLIGYARGINAIEFGATWSRVRGNGTVAKLSRGKFVDHGYVGKLVTRTMKLRGDTGLGAKWSTHLGQAPTVHAGSFIARGKNGALLVFERELGTFYHPVYGWKAGSKSKRIETIRGVGQVMVGQMLKHGRRPERLVDFAIRTLQAAQTRLLRN